ncbi:lipopolysaccharide biosynthesis protein [Salinicoccus siamensis]|uniref:Lipopolysaccharide biosynthesis protein n=1 Tax=Salinicoccus siamensis TaxID=381830 RepID=A0ABV5Z4H5_9STAP
MDIFKKVFKSNFAKNIMIIASGTASAQLLTAALSPVITRIYSPEDYGVLTVYIAILSLFSIGALMYEKAIPISENEHIATNVLALSILALISYSTLAMFVIFFLRMTSLFGEFLYNYGFLIPVGIFMVGLFSIFKQWAFRYKNFKLISATTITQSVWGNTFKIVFGLLNLGPLGLLLGSIINQSSGVLRLSKQLVPRRKILFNNIEIKEIIKAMKRYKGFPMYNVPVYFIRMLSDRLPIIFITLFFGLTVSGLYGLAFTIVKMPLNLLGNSVGNVFYAEAASIAKTNPKRLRNLSNKLIGKLLVLGLIPFLILVIFGPFLFGLIFGRAWEEAGVYARIIAIMLLFSLVFSPISRVYEIYEKQRLSLVLNVIQIILILIVFTISLIFNFNSYLAIFLYAIVKSVMSFVIYIIAQKLINKEIETKNIADCKIKLDT